MKTAWTIVFLSVVLGIAGAVLVNAQQAQPTPDAATLVSQLHTIGCNAEEQAAANTISQLQKENADLKKQILKFDPPKSGATKH